MSLFFVPKSAVGGGRSPQVAALSCREMLGVLRQVSGAIAALDSNSPGGTDRFGELMKEPIGRFRLSTSALIEDVQEAARDPESSEALTRFARELAELGAQGRGVSYDSACCSLRVLVHCANQFTVGSFASELDSRRFSRD